MAIIKRIHRIANPSVENIDTQNIKEGDLLILSFGRRDAKASKMITVELVKETKTDGIEIIYDLKKNHYFSLTKFRAAESSIYSIYRIKM